MSFIIKGIDIPKTCRQCPCCGDNGLVGMQRDYFCTALDCATSIDELDQKLTDCPLVEIPTPHGRLIDADRLLALVEKEVNNTCIGCEPEPDDCCAYDRFKEIISEIKTAQTIIEGA